MEENPQQAKRKWFQFHFSTAVAMLAAAAVVFAINCFSAITWENERSIARHYGWPYAFIATFESQDLDVWPYVKSVGTTTQNGHDYDTYQLTYVDGHTTWTTSIPKCEPLSLFKDVFIWLLLGVAAGLIVEAFVRHGIQRPLLRFHLSTYVIFIVALSLGVGYFMKVHIDNRAVVKLRVKVDTLERIAFETEQSLTQTTPLGSLFLHPKFEYISESPESFISECRIIQVTKDNEERLFAHLKFTVSIQNGVIQPIIIERLGGVEDDNFVSNFALKFPQENLSWTVK